MYIISDNDVNTIIYFLKILFINIGTYCIYLRLSNNKSNKIKTIKYGIISLIVSSICTIIGEKINTLNSRILQIILLTVIFTKLNKENIGYTTIITILSLAVSNIIFFMSLILNGFPNVFFSINSDSVAFIFIILVYFFILYYFLKIKRLKNGITFLRKDKFNDLFDVFILNISTIILISVEILSNYNLYMSDKVGWGIVIFSIIMTITIIKSFNVYYKQKLLFQQLAEANNEIQEKQKEIERLEEENLNFSKRSHSMAHKQKALEYKLNQLLMNEETTKEIGIAAEIKELSKELYKKPIEELTKTGIQKIDDMLKFMQSECIKNNIDINLQITGNVYHIINNIITVEQLEILIADHIKDAIIAIKHTDNVNKSILVKLGKIDECYGLYIYDSGIEFEKETLENLGKKPSTTHKDEGGTGMGFMNTFDTLRSCKGSLIIKEIGKPSKDNFTKIIMIKFDGKNEYKVIPYR